MDKKVISPAIWAMSFGMVLLVLSESTFGEQGPAKSRYCPARSSRPAGGQLRFNFETGDLQGWQVVEGSLDYLISDRETFRTQPDVRHNKQGKYFLDTYNGQDGMDYDIGVIESPVFVLTKPHVSFLVGGGSQPEDRSEIAARWVPFLAGPKSRPDTYVALCTEDGSEVLWASGKSAHLMQRIKWDAKDYVGQKLFLRIVDKNVFVPWGQITFDDFVATGEIDQEATIEHFNKYEALQKKRQAARAKRRAELLSDKALFARGTTRTYRGEHLGAIDFTVGGIGTGCIRFNGKAKPFVWQIFNNMPQAFVPHSFFAVRAKPRGSEAVVRALQTEAVGPFQAMKSLSFRGEYPFARFDFKSSALPVQVTMEVFNPLVPLDAESSSIPCVVYNLTAENKCRKDVEVSFLAAQQNAVGFTGKGKIDGRSFAGYGANTNKVLAEKDATILHMMAERRKDDPSYGDMALMVLEEEAEAIASWDSLEGLMKDWLQDGVLTISYKAGPSPTAQTLDGALAVPFTLKPGQKRTVTFVLSWHFPNGTHGGPKGWVGRGNMYSNRWTDALAVARHLRGCLGELTMLTRLYHDTFYATNLPYWLLDRMTSQVAVLRSRTCFWTEDGYFGGWEGCMPDKGCCHGNATHVWGFAQAHARLFPAIARRMRQEALGAADPNGGIKYRQIRIPAVGLFGAVAFDGLCAEILAAYREHLCSPEPNWLNAHWTGIKKAMGYAIRTHDSDEDGLLTGHKHGFDVAHSGCTPWMGTMYLAALAASEKMAELENDTAAAERYQRIRASGTRKQNERMWNGEYYIQIADPKSARDYLDGCHVDQMLGQWWANQLNLGWLHPQNRVRKALKSLFKYNFKANFHGVTQYPRKFVADNDAGLLTITWPKGPRPQNHFPHCDEAMSGLEYSAAVAMVQAGLMREGFVAVKAIADRYNGRLNTEVTGKYFDAWGYSGNPFGDDECGKFYARALSVWSMLLACQGFVYDGPAGVIGFKPIWKPEDHKSFFTSAEGWGLFTQRCKTAIQTEQIEVKYGKLKVGRLLFQLPEGTSSVTVSVELNGKTVEQSFNCEADRQLSIDLKNSLTITAGQTLNVVIQTAK